jgi:hypothetical protein
MALTVVKLTGSGNWSVPAGVSILNHVLMVAGGGGGGAWRGGGGGAGGIVHLTDVDVSAVAELAYSVGAGGAGGFAANVSDASGTGGSGGNTTFGDHSATGGGGGGFGSNTVNGGASGGSGGGAGGADSTGAQGPGAAVSGQGYGGGNSFNSTAAENRAGGGGGGRGAAGGNAASGVGGNGGSGLDLSSVFGTLYGAAGVFGGGGGGATNASSGTQGAGGSGGGGAANGAGSSVSGSAETGGGGGGAGGGAFAVHVGGAGGSGVILIAYEEDAVVPAASFTLTTLAPTISPWIVNIPAAAFTLTAMGLMPYTLAPPNNQVVRSVFRAYLVTPGYPDLELPISSFQARTRLSTPNYLAVVVPNPLPYIDAITERSAGRLVIKTGFALADDTEVLEELTSGAFNRFRYDLGPFSGSATLVAYDYRAPRASLTRTIRGISLRSMSDGVRRIRCEPDMYLQPGDVADLGDGETLTVEQISYIVGASQATMEISEAEPI